MPRWHSRGEWPGRQKTYPLVNCYRTMERSTMLLMGQSTISMAIFNSYWTNNQRVSFILLSTEQSEKVLIGDLDDLDDWVTTRTTDCHWSTAGDDHPWSTGIPPYSTSLLAGPPSLGRWSSARCPLPDVEKHGQKIHHIHWKTGEGKIYSRPRCFPWNIRSFIKFPWTNSRIRKHGHFLGTLLGPNQKIAVCAVLLSCYLNCKCVAAKSSVLANL